MIGLALATQEPFGLSTVESEWYSLVRGGCVGIGFEHMAKDLGLTIKPRLHGVDKSTKTIEF
eukprot:3586679-Prorocentrum_lima.AAC.1